MSALRKLGRLIVAGAIVILTLIILMDKVVMPLYVRHGQEKFLPNVVGMPYPEAARTLRAAGFKMQKADVARTQEYPPNQVFEMYPKAYSRVKKGRIVQLTVTEEERMVTVPDLIGKSLRSSEIAVARVGLHIDTIMTTYSDEFASEAVTWQSIKGGNFLRRGLGLALMVSKGTAPPTFYVPSVIAMGFQAGRRELLDAGLDIGRIKYLYAPYLLPNTIIDQSIPGGTVLKVKRLVSLTVSTYDRDK